MAYLRLCRAPEASDAAGEATCVIRLYRGVPHQPRLP